MSRTLTAIAIIAGALLTYLMWAVLHWSFDPGDWSMKARGWLVIVIWPLTCGVIAVALHQSREDW